MDMPRPKCKDESCRERSLKGSSYCDSHRKEKFKADQKTYSTEPFYQTRTWKRIRLRQLSKFPLCKSCEDRGRVTGASVADHIKPIKNGGNKFDSSNLQSLCTTCHNSKRGLERWSK